MVLPLLIPLSLSLSPSVCLSASLSLSLSLCVCVCVWICLPGFNGLGAPFIVCVDLHRIYQQFVRTGLPNRVTPAFRKDLAGPFVYGLMNLSR